MEQKTKKCPYCGEKIMITAKKCKHCGEWIVRSTNEVIQKKVRKESLFPVACLYDEMLMKLLFFVTIIGSFIQSVHRSKLIETGAYRSVVHYISGIPETLGDFIFFIGDLAFFILLMKVFSNLHKSLKVFFSACVISRITLYIILIFDPFSENSLEETDIISSLDFALLVIAFFFFILEFVLSIMIISNYEGKIKILGWVMIVYRVCETCVGLVTDFFVPEVAFLMIFLTDYFYYSYLKKTLTI